MRARMAGAVLSLVLLAACGQKETAARTDLAGGTPDTLREAGSNLPPEMKVQVDSGNAAFRAGDYEEALKHYQAATKINPHYPAGWFGISMAQTKLGNKAAADSAMMQAHRMAPGSMMGHPVPMGEGDPHAGIPGMGTRAAPDTTGTPEGAGQEGSQG